MSNVIDFKAALAHARQKVPAPGKPQPQNTDASGELQATRLSLSYYEEDRQAVFEDQAEHARNAEVFARWGLRLDDYMHSVDDLLAVLSSSVHWHHLLNDKKAAIGPADQRWLAAVRRGDGSGAARLFADTEAAARLAERLSLNRAQEATLAARVSRADARQNAVFAYLLEGPIRPGGASALDVLEELFAGYRQSEAEDPILVLGAWLTKQGDTVTKNLDSRGLQLRTECPVRREVGVLVNWANLEPRMARSRLKSDWQTLLGPFIGFDQNWGLLMPADLTFHDAACRAQDIPLVWHRGGAVPDGPQGGFGLRTV
ncbi:hypothetical protein [Ramlibacter alkalitolerans]|uniref:Uncharacterized protein n=1 Tax=Ramlibacter alkalitolerans TaxID=2039631 RepID=A0ABS1JTV2_9BURK|nr:hypothetical protein [Ramlibacter alkalitolerans]MBL0427657.1 hypothetical protein [Ramlibacter alkalitolerans]